MKTEFVCVKPRSSQAKSRFNERMDRLHSCRVEKREYGRMYLSSISGRYHFTMSEIGDDHWEIIS